MEQLIGDWLNWLALRRAAETCTGYGFDVRALAKWGAAQSPPVVGLDDWRTAHLTRYLAECRSAGVGASATKRRVAAMRGFFKWACGGKSPARRLPYPRVPRRVQRTLSAAEVLAVLAACDTSTVTGARDTAVFMLLYDSGLRASEVCRLRIADVDLERRVFVVVVKGGDPKCGFFSAPTAAALAAWLGARASVAAAGVETVFVGLGYDLRRGKPRRGQPLTRGGLKCLCRRAAGRAGVKAFSPHAWRRAFSCGMTLANCPTRMLQFFGRWDSFQHVEEYTRWLMAQMATADATLFDRYSPVLHLLGAGPGHAP